MYSEFVECVWLPYAALLYQASDRFHLTSGFITTSGSGCYAENVNCFFFIITFLVLD